MPHAGHARGAGGPVRRPHRLRQPRRGRRRPGRRHRPRRPPAAAPTDVLGTDARATASTPWCSTSSRPARAGDEIALSPPVLEALDTLRDVPVRAGVPADRGRARSTQKAIGVVRSLFAYYRDHPEEVPAEYLAAPGDLATTGGRLHRRHDGPVRPPDVRAALPSPGLAPVAAREQAAGEGPRGRGGSGRRTSDAVRERSDIVKVVSRLPAAARRPAATRWSGICPFHQREDGLVLASAPPSRSTTASAAARAATSSRSWSKVENLTFAEAVERLAREAGITLRYEGETRRRPAARRAPPGHAPRAWPTRRALYHRTLLEGREGADARAYLAVAGDHARRASSGSASATRPATPTSCCGGCPSRTRPELLVEAGLVTQGRRRRAAGPVPGPGHVPHPRPVGQRRGVRRASWPATGQPAARRPRST